MFGPKRDPWHTRPDDEPASEAAYPQDAADEAQQQRKRKWLWRIADVAADILGEIIEAILDGI